MTVNKQHLRFAGIALLFLSSSAAMADDSKQKEYFVWNAPAYEGLYSRLIPHTALAGNGDVGVISGGTACQKSFIISKGDFWGYNDSPFPIGEIVIRPVRQEYEHGPSLALGAKARASSHLEHLTPERTVNGAFARNYEGWVSSIGNPQWLELDLGELKRFDRLIVRHAEAGGEGRKSVNTKEFSIRARLSEDAPWQELYSTATNASAVTDLKFESPVSARFLRIDIAKGTQETNDDARRNPRGRICQVELYDSKADADFVKANSPVPTSHFREEQDMRNASIRTEMELDGIPVEMETKVMADSNLVLVKLKSKSAKDADLVIDIKAKSDNRSFKCESGSAGTMAHASRIFPRSRKEDPRSFTTKATLGVRIVGAPAQASADGNGTGSLSFTLKAGKSLWIAIAVAGGARTYDSLGNLAGAEPLEEAGKLLALADSPAKIDALVAGHAKWWKDFLGASSVKLDSSDPRLVTVQRYYDVWKYLLGSTLRKGKTASGLYGIWHATDNSPWHSDYHLNYNFIAGYYSLGSMNHPELILPAVEAIGDFIPYGASDAAAIEKFAHDRPYVREFIDRKIADGSISPSNGIPGGILFPVGIGPWGMKLDRSYHNQTMNAPFSVHPFVSYYEYTRDGKFLKAVLYPYLKKILKFLEHWVVKDEAGSYSIYAGINEGSWAVNSIGELGIYRLCLEYAIAASEELGVDAKERAVWQDLEKHLAPYRVIEYDGKKIYAMCEKEFKNGEWRQWQSRPNRLTLEPIFPALRFGYYSKPEEIEIWQNTIAHVDQQNNWGQINAFPELYTQAVRMRYDPERIISKLAETIKRFSATNGTLDDQNHGIEKGGAIEALNNMLVMSHRGVVKAFPNWLADKNASFRNLRLPGAFLASGSYSGEKRAVESFAIKSLAGGKLCVAEPWPGAGIADSAGRKVKLVRSSAPDHPEETVLSFSTKAGETYTFRR